MEHMKKLFLFSMVLVLVFSNIVYAESDPSTWAVDEVNKLKAENILDEAFFTNYQQNITRKEFAYLSVRLFEVMSGEVAEIGEDPFTDTDDEWVLKGYNIGILKGYGGGVYGPDDLITREQLAALLIRMLDGAEVEYDKNIAGLSFNDDNEISEWAKDCVYLANKNGIVGGIGDNLMAPKNNATKEQSMLMAMRIINMNINNVIVSEVAENEDEKAELTWSSVVNLSNSEGESFSPVITADILGNIHLIWVEESNDYLDLYYRQFNNGKWSDNINVTNSDRFSIFPDIACDELGNIHVVWEQYYPGTSYILYSYYNGLDWAKPYMVSRPYILESRIPRISLDSAGDPHVIWFDKNTVGSIEMLDIHYSGRDGDKWTVTECLELMENVFTDDPNRVLFPDIEIDESDNIHVVWPDMSFSNFTIDIFHNQLGGVSVSISDNNGRSQFPKLAKDESGVLHVAWEDDSSGQYEVLYSWLDGRQWTEAVNVSKTSGDSMLPSIAVDDERNVHIVWVDDSTGNYEILYSCWDGIEWTEPENLSESVENSTDPSITTDISGNIHVMWAESIFDSHEIYYRVKSK
ncbi:S-layer homology domain-containing protein [Dethiosulfatibacter aminovorans DSM 17477]|uniref:S-layer homology domain-containing protein n=1 Tax=Dethiosulfatibacter aminovorans DSM 17477 TaxID=1121476 RepID=A0A1M6N4K3_9FIRM|nr:S-layer homology domain-containing protein [Dethiosulfatibacter aminovorans]SHJ90608.1 S-layer homology domain-containing protein [Dethiosulfatibacter aminovorans DSM 17477]